MPNPSGKNSPESFDEFAPTKAYGSQQRGNRLREQAPMAGQGESTHALQTARRAVETATKSASKQIADRAKERAQQGPEIPQPPARQATPESYAQIWDELASTPGASDLVKQYASGV